MSPATSDSALHQALAHHQAGRLTDAEPVYRRVLAANPDNPDALHLLGLLLQQKGDAVAGLAHIDRAIAIAPTLGAYHASRARVLAEMNRLDDSLAAARRAVELQPDDPDIQNNIGAALSRVNRPADSEAAFRRAISLRPQNADYHNNLGNVLLSLGRKTDAIAAYRQAISLRPDYAPTHVNIANALHSAGQTTDAIAAYRRAIAIDFKNAETHFALAAALAEQGQPDQAVVSYRAAIAVRPNYFQALSNLGTTLESLGLFDDAIAALGRALAVADEAARPEILLSLGHVLLKTLKPAESADAYRQAIALRPAYADAHVGLGNALHAQHQSNAAIAAYNQALSLRPDFHRLHSNIGNALKDAGRFTDAIAAYQKCLDIQHDELMAQVNLATALKDAGRVDDAVHLYRRVLAAHPDSAVAAFNLSMTLLLQGHYEEGFLLHEQRWKLPELRLGPPRTATPWDGKPFPGKRLLIYLEQGFGDMLMYGRYVPMAAKLGGEIILECYPEMRRLFAHQHWPGISRLVARSESPGQFDLHVAMASLPYAFRSTIDTIPQTTPYLMPPAEAAAQWRTRLNNLPGKKIGLVWAGKQIPTPLRSIGPKPLAPLASIPNVTWISLQKGDTGDPTPPPFAFVDWTSELKDFADTAALIDGLDLVLTIDSAVAHLAGAMGKPTWTLLPLNPDWRWRQSGLTTPWYPTMRLFRQRAFDDWSAPLTQVVAELTQFVAQST